MGTGAPTTAGSHSGGDTAKLIEDLENELAKKQNAFDHKNDIKVLMDKLTNILEEKGNDIALAKVYDKATKQLADLRKMSRQIESNKDIDADDKRAEMNRIRILMSDIAKQMESIRTSR